MLSPISVVKDSTAVTCYGLSDGTASATVSGGLAPYTYLWQRPKFILLQMLLI